MITYEKTRLPDDIEPGSLYLMKTDVLRRMSLIIHHGGSVALFIR